MKNIDRYLDEIVSDLPMEEAEKEEFKEELYLHLQEHINELMIMGNTEEEAVSQAIASFGNENKLNRELKRTLFSFHKLVRFVWSVVFVTVFLCLVSYSAMEFYHPEFANTLPFESVLAGFFIVVLIAGAAEAIYESLNEQFKWRWLENQWFFFLSPSLIFGGIQAISLFKYPEQYPEALWLDPFAIPIGAVAYLIARQLFSLLFLKKNRKKLVN